MSNPDECHFCKSTDTLYYNVHDVPWGYRLMKLCSTHAQVEVLQKIMTNHVIKVVSNEGLNARYGPTLPDHS